MLCQLLNHNGQKVKRLQRQGDKGQAASVVLDILPFLCQLFFYNKAKFNAQVIGSLRSEFSTLKGEINTLIKKMNVAIETSNRFVSDITR